MGSQPRSKNDATGQFLLHSSVCFQTVKLIWEMSFIMFMVSTATQFGQGLTSPTLKQVKKFLSPLLIVTNESLGNGFFPDELVYRSSKLVMSKIVPDIDRLLTFNLIHKLLRSLFYSFSPISKNVLLSVNISMLKKASTPVKQLCWK